MENFSDLVDAFLEELPDFVSSVAMVGICLIYIFIKLKSSKKKGTAAQLKNVPNNNQQRRQTTYAPRNQGSNTYGRQGSNTYGRQGSTTYRNQAGRSVPTNQQRPNTYNQTANRAGGSYDRPNAQLFGESSAMPHEHRKSGVYDTYNKKSWRNDSGTMPHKHEAGHYTSMMDVSRLPKGYILLNGEPVRVADLEGK